MKRMQSKKSYSWWWDGHISPKNNKWLAENLEEMDRSVKRMLKLIEEEGDSFAKKAEMYYQKRPELIAHVEEFYRMYRSLAERYDHLTGELRKSIPTDLQSQGSGISENGSESAIPGTNQRLSRRRSGSRAAGFEFFLGAGGAGSDVSRKESGESSSLSSSSESESDGTSSKNTYMVSPMNGEGEGRGRKIIELEVELREVKEKLRLAEEENSNALSKTAGYGNYEELLGRITWYEEELKVANERLQLSEEKIARLKVELRQVLELQEQIAVLETKVPDPVDKVEILEKQLTITNRKLEASEKEIGRLKLELDRIKASQAIHDLQSQLESENSHITGLETAGIDQERGVDELEEEKTIKNNKLWISDEIARLKIELEKNEMIAGLETNIPASVHKIEALERELTHTNKKLETSEEEIGRLKLVLDRNGSSDVDHAVQLVSDPGNLENGLESETSCITSMGADAVDQDCRIKALEEELSISNNKLQIAEEEIARLKVEFEKNELLVATNVSLHIQLESARKDIKTREAELQSEQNRISELQEQIMKLETDVSDQQVQLESAQKDIETRNAELELEKKQISELQEQIMKLEITVSDQQVQLESARKDIETRDAELELEKKQISELQELIMKLKNNVSDQQIQLEYARKDVETRDAELELEKKQISELQEQIMKLETNVSDQQIQLESGWKDIETRETKLDLKKIQISELQEQIMKLEAALSDQQGQLESAQKDSQIGDMELESDRMQISDLQEQIIKLETDLSARDEEIGELKINITEAERRYSLEKGQLQEVISGLSESCAFSEARLKELELKVQSLEEQIKRVEAEKSENQLLYLTCETGMKNEIEQLKADIAERSNFVEDLNKSLDAFKLKYDMLMAEKDNLDAKVLALNSEVGSRDDRIHQMDEHLNRLHMEHVELISRSEAACKLVQELESKEKELEEEVERQRVVISEAADEKREAIRQLCLSIEHYRNGYNQLRQAFLLHKQPIVMAS